MSHHFTTWLKCTLGHYGSVPPLARFAISVRGRPYDTIRVSGGGGAGVVVVVVVLGEAPGPWVFTLAFAEMCFVMSTPQMLVHTCSCSIVWCFQLHIFLRERDLLAPSVSMWVCQSIRWPLCLPGGNAQGSSLPLGSFWTHIKLLCCVQPHAGVWEFWAVCNLAVQLCL